MSTTSAAPEGVKEPVLALIYGPSGCGKTTDSGLSFPNALFIAAPGALQSIKNVAGFTPTCENARTIRDVIDLIHVIGKAKAKDPKIAMDAVVIDDFSYVVQETFSALERKFSGFSLWGELRDQVLEFRTTARFAGLHIIVNAWEQGPRDKNGVRVKGGPMLSGNLPEQVPAMFDIVLRAGLDPMRKPWPGVYFCAADPAYIMKDRLNIAPRCHPAPMNIGELVRAAGYNVSRLPQLAWQEPVVKKLAEKFVTAGATGDKEGANSAFADLRKNGVPPGFAAWTVRDALDRAVIHRALETQASTFFL